MQFQQAWSSEVTAWPCNHPRLWLVSECPHHVGGKDCLFLRRGWSTEGGGCSGIPIGCSVIGIESCSSVGVEYSVTDGDCSSIGGGRMLFTAVLLFLVGLFFETLGGSTRSLGGTLAGGSWLLQGPVLCRVQGGSFLLGSPLACLPFLRLRGCGICSGRAQSSYMCRHSLH